MILSKTELLDLFQSVYDVVEKSMEVMRKQASEDLKSYAENNEISGKTIREAYKLFKAFKEGKVTSKDEDYFTILAIIEEEFANENGESNKADLVAG